MLLLGRTFPLRDCLKGHILVDIIEETHKILKQELEIQRLQEQIDDLLTQKTEPVNAAACDSTPICAKCNRRLWRVRLAALAPFLID